MFGDCHFHLAINYADFCMRLSASVVVRMADSISGIFSSNLDNSHYMPRHDDMKTFQALCWDLSSLYSKTTHLDHMRLSILLTALPLRPKHSLHVCSQATSMAAKSW